MPSGPRPLVAPAWLRERLERKRASTIPVHASTSRRVYNRRHLPGAIYSDVHRELAARGHAPETGEIEREWLVPSREDAQRLLQRWGVGAGDHVVFYDDVGQNRHAIRGYWLLRLYRFPAELIHVLDGGLGAWRAAGGETIAGSALPEASRAEPREVPTLGAQDPSLIATADEVLAWSRESSSAGGPTRLLDVRTPDEFVGRDVRALHGGHVPGARQRLFSDLLTPEGTLRPAPEILDLVRASGVEPSELRAAYCQGGVRAALAWFALHEVAGLTEVRNYAGSWEEWGNRTELPVATVEEPS